MIVQRRHVKSSGTPLSRSHDALSHIPNLPVSAASRMSIHRPCFPSPQINKKEQHALLLTTYLKNIHTRIKKVTTATKAIEKTMCEDKGGTFTYHNGVELGECHKMDNIFVKGVEQVDLEFSHSYITHRIAVPADVNRHNVPVKLFAHVNHEHNKYEKENLAFEFGKGDSHEPVKLHLYQWFEEIFHMHLDDENYEAGKGENHYPLADYMKEPRYRTTGLGIKIRIDYLDHTCKHPGKVPDGVFVRESDVTACVTAELSSGWHDFGSEVHYNDLANYTLGHDFPTFDESGEVYDMAFTDRYKRGVSFAFEVGGQIAEISYIDILMSLASLSVILAICPLIISIFAFYIMGHKSQIYKNKAKEDVSVDREHAKVAAQVLVAAATWKSMAQNLNSEVTKDELQKIFEKNGIHEVSYYDGAADLSNAVMDEVKRIHYRKSHHDEIDTKLKFVDWANLLTNDSMGFDTWLAREEQAKLKTVSMGLAPPEIVVENTVEPETSVVPSPGTKTDGGRGRWI